MSYKSIFFGASSNIGKGIYDKFLSRGRLLAGTKNNSERNGLLKFDLTTDNLKDLDVELEEVDYGIIAAAITKLDYIKNNREETDIVNIDGTKKLIDNLFENNIVPVYFSSDYVFFGDKGEYRENDDRNPRNAYGIQKKIIEDYLVDSGKDFLVFRLSKVYGITPGDGTFLTSSIESLINGNKVRLASDQIFSPIYNGDLLNALDEGLNNNIRGIYNLGSSRPYSRFDFVQLATEALGIDSKNLIPILLEDIKFDEIRPLNTSLKIDKFISDTGFRLSTNESIFRRMKEEYEKINI